MSPICSCNNKAGMEFEVVMANGERKTVTTEQAARTLVRINGGSYSKTK